MRLGETEMAKLICPNCGAATSFSPACIAGKGILRGESTDKYTKWGEVEIQAVIPYQYGEISYAILVCRACNEFFVAINDEYSEEGYWEVVYPIPRRTASEEIPEPIKSEFEEANLCFAIGAYRACVAMCQIALEALWRDKEASSIKDLEERGVISSVLRQKADEIRLWGNVAKHEPIPDAVSKEDAEQLLTYLEILLNDVYVEPKRLGRLKQKREQIEKKQS